MVDEITGRMYTEIESKLHPILEIASHWHQEESAVTPMTEKQGLTGARERALGEESDP